MLTRWDRFLTLALAWVLLCTAAPSPGNVGDKRSVVLQSGITMRYLVAGREGGAPLILLHGLGDTSRSWALVLPELADSHAGRPGPGGVPQIDEADATEKSSRHHFVATAWGSDQYARGRKR